MVAQRQDALTEEDDLILAEVTLRHIREGSTQLAAFEEVGQKLGRTAAACGFRWNSLVRKKYESAIQIAKAQRNQLKAQKRKKALKQDNDRMSDSVPNGGQNNLPVLVEGEREGQTKTDEGITYDDVIRFLRRQKESYKRMKQIDKLISEKEKEIEALKEENEKIKKELDSMQEEYRIMNEDYQALMRIMERARKLAFLGEEEEPLSFKMDKNGNLERLEKSP